MNHQKAKPPFRRGMILPENPEIRKQIPVTTGAIDYFPRALAAVAFTSKVGNDQHNPGQPLHWAKEKSRDHADCIPRHLADRHTLDTDGVPHRFKLAWRALADLETFLEDNPGYLGNIIQEWLDEKSKARMALGAATSSAPGSAYGPVNTDSYWADLMEKSMSPKDANPIHPRLNPDLVRVIYADEQPETNGTLYGRIMGSHR